MHNRTTACMSLAIALAAITGCGDAPASTGLDVAAGTTGITQPIINGQLAGSGAFDAVGALVTTDKYGRTLSICTGTLIAPDVVLTAAHCIRPRALPPAGWQMWFTTAHDATLFAYTQPTRLSHTLVHPDYDPDAELMVPLAWRGPTSLSERQAIAELEALCDTEPKAALNVDFWQCVAGLSPDLQARLGLMDGAINMRDVGLAILAKPIDGASLAQLPTSVTGPVWPTQRMYAVGYGVFDVPKTTGERGIRHVGAVSLDGVGQFELQVGFSQSQVAFGDSGGPLFVAGDLAQEIVGIASRSLVNDDGDCQGPTLYAKASAFTPWIRASLREACRERRRDVQMCKAHPF